MLLGNAARWGRLLLEMLLRMLLGMLLLPKEGRLLLRLLLGNAAPP